MSYETALTIANVIESVHQKKFLLPAIQREFVWDTGQIEKLFDSLMRDYPISSFLFWKVEKEHVNDYEFYEFLREYHERDHRHNPKANVSGAEELVAVLDGQQRLTSLYLALKGTYADKEPRKRWDNDNAYPKRKLYLNLVNGHDNPEFEYNFRFLKTKDVINDDKNYWFPVSKILDIKEPGDVNEYLNEHIFDNYTKEERKYANSTLFKLYNVIHHKGSISYYNEKSQELDKVLNIFIRVNSGGTILSYSDLLLSIATAQWSKRDAREEIISFVEEINKMGDGFNFNKDFVLKSCLVLNDFSNIAFKVDNFNKANMLKIEDSWDEVTNAIRIAVGLVDSFGYSRDTLSSNNAIIPIAYYLLKIGARENYITSSKNIEDKAKIKKWLVLTLIKQAFSGQPDNILRPIRKIINENHDYFPLDKIVQNFKGTSKSITFSNEDIDNLLWYKYGQGFTFSVMTLLYPTLDYRHQFHIDHIFPKSKFTRAYLRKKGVAENDIDYYIENYNYIGNLQLLEATPNIEKQNLDFDKWLTDTYPSQIDQQQFKKTHFIPSCSLDFVNFIEFLDKREALLLKRFKEVLQYEIVENELEV